MHAILLALSLLLAPTASGQPSAQAPEPGTHVVWVIDTGHSELSFRIRHLVSRVWGTFRQWEGTLTGSPDDWSTASVAVRIDAASIDTNNERRDSHLRAEDFFAVAQHPTLTFESSRFEVDRDRIRLHGDLTLRGVTRPVVLEGTYLGSITDLQGRRRAAFEAEATVNRQEFGIIWNRTAETGTRNVGRYVTEDLGQDGEFGTIEVGKWADLVLLQANPLTDVANARNPIGVMVGGRWLPADELEQRIKANAEALARGTAR